jgi:DtxR family Mn-dependent transcriptional regulator
MTEIITQTIQDYLKTIYSILENADSASTTELATRLSITPASVTGMIQRLSSTTPQLVNYRKHQGVTLTPAGKRAALEVIRHHRLIETYLVKTLGYSWDEVHSEADLLEHFISENFESRIAKALGNPSRDPHGELIPTADLSMPTDSTLPLSSLRPDQSATIIRVCANDTALLRHLENLGLTPGAQLAVVMYSPFDQNMSLQLENRQTITIGEIISSRIFVEVTLSSDNV